MFRSSIFTRSLLQKRRHLTTGVMLSLVLGGLLVSNWQLVSNATANQNTSTKQIPTAVPATLPAPQTPAQRAANAATTSPTLTQDNLEQQQGCTVGCGATVPATGTTGQAVAFASTATPTGCATQPPTTGISATAPRVRPNKIRAKHTPLLAATIGVSR